VDLASLRSLRRGEALGDGGDECTLDCCWPAFEGGAQRSAGDAAGESVSIGMRAQWLLPMLETEGTYFFSIFADV